MRLAGLVLAAALAAACGTPGSLRDFAQKRGVSPAATGCSAVRETPDLGADHLEPGKDVVYPSYPPASGPHDAVPLPAGVYAHALSDEPAGSGGDTIFRAVHSLEHGYVLVFYQDLTSAQVSELSSAFDGARKVIVAPAPKAPSKLTLVAWRRVQECSAFDTQAIEDFVTRFRESTAPEPNAL